MGIGDDVGAARGVVNAKKVLLDKVGKARGIVDKIVESRELALSTDVSVVVEVGVL